MANTILSKQQLPEDVVYDTDLSQLINAHNTANDSHQDIRDTLDTATVLPTYNSTTHKIEFTTIGGSTYEIDLPMEDAVDSVTYNSSTKIITVHKIDGTSSTIDLSGLIDTYTGGENTETKVTIDGNKEITVAIKKINASKIDYDNTSSSLTATNTQDAIDELKTAIDTADSDITSLETRMDTAESDIDNLEDTKVDKVTGKQLSTEDFTTAFKTKLEGIEEGAEVNVNADWDANSGDAEILNKPTTIAGYGITDAYTKTEVDTKLTVVYKYKGSVNTYEDLPTTGQAVGDVYNVATKDTTHHIKAGDNVAWNGTQWDVLAGDVDLTDYYTKTETNDLLDDKVDKVTGKQLSTEDYTTAEKTKLSGIEDNAEVNIIETVKVNGTALTPDQDRAVDITIAGDADHIDYDNTTSGLDATNVQDAIDELADEKVDKESGKGLSTNDFTDNYKNKLDDIEDNAEVNIIETIKVNGTALTPDTNRAVDITIAGDAANITYDNTTSGLTADDVQEAIDELADEKVDKVTGKQLSTEDYTTAEKNKLADIEANADVNTIESISVNGTAQTIDANKNVDIDVPTKVSDLTNDLNFIDNTVNDLVNYTTTTDLNDALDDKADKATTLAGYGITDAYTKTEIDTKVSSVYRYKGSVQTYADLPSSDQVVGDVYNIETADPTHSISAGDNVAWNGTTWDKLGGDIDLSDYYTKTQTDTLLDDKVDKVTGKGLSTEDYTTVEKTKLAGIEDSAEVNIIETVKIDGTALTPDSNRAVDIDLSGKVNEPTTEGTNGQVLTTDGNGGRTWANAVSAIKDLSDVNLNTSTLAEGQILKYNATNDEWNNTDLDIATASTNGLVHPDDDTIHVDNTGEISVDEDFKKIFIGTKAEWDALSTTEKLTYKQVNITDDESSTEGIKEYIRNQNILSEPELMDGTSESGFTLSTTNSECPYDGFITLGYNIAHGRTLIVNDVARAMSSSYSGMKNTLTYPVKKGDLVRVDDAIALSHTYNNACWYKLRDYTGR